MGKVVFFRFQAIVVTGIISVFAVFSPPVFSQETEGGEGESILIESTITGDVDPSKAVTIERVTIPIDELELLVIPLTIEELQVEAAAWLLLLRNKVQEISKTEIAIKQENQAIEQAEEGTKRIQEAETQLKQAEAALAQASPGTPEHEQATKKQEEAKKALQKARQAIEEALAIVKDQGELEEKAKVEKQIATAREVLKEARKEREDLASGSTAYEAATQKIDALDQALIDLEAAEEKLKGAVPDSDEYKELSKTLEEARAKVIEATKAISDAGLAPKKAEDGASVESEDSEETLKDITGNIEDAQGEDKTEEDAEDTENTKDKAVTNSSQLAGVTQKLEALIQTQSGLKDQLAKNLGNLEEDKTKITERFEVVLDALDKKGGDTASYRTYIEAISAFKKVDITDTQCNKNTNTNLADIGARWYPLRSKFG